MLKLTLSFLILAFATQVASAQFSVRLQVDSSSSILEKELQDALRDEFSKLKDVTIASKGDFDLVVQLLERPTGTAEADIFISTVSTSAATCIVGEDENGKVYSRQRCKEFLSSDIHAIRRSELKKIAKEIVMGFDGFALEPLRNIE